MLAQINQLVKDQKSVTLRVKNIMWPVRARYANKYVGPEHLEYTGKLIRQSWFKPNEVGVTTEDPNHPFRVVAVERIVEINGEVISSQLDPPKIVTKTVTGSKGDIYTVTNNAGILTCTCQGYTFRKSCKHLTEAFKE